MEAVSTLIMAACATAAVCPWLIGFLKRRSLVDHENGRTSHKGAVPRGGGLAVLFGAAVTMAVHWTDWINEPHLRAVAIFSVAFGLLGLIDDIHTLPATVRLVTQAILTSLFLWFTGIEPLPSLALVGVVMAGVWIMFFVNTFNFMDGINGISAASTCIIGTSLAVASYRWDAGIEIPALAVVGAAVGFAPFNALAARVFLGDVGSYLLGSGLALLAVVGVTGGIPIVAAGLPFLLYAADVAWTLTHRVYRRQRVLKSHREHVYQRLTEPRRLSHQQATLVVSAATVTLALIAQLAGGVGPLVQAPLVLLALGVVLSYLALPRLARFRA